MSQPAHDVTQILEQVHRGDAEARDRLIALVYQEVRQVASRMMAAERKDHTLQPTALVNEAMLRMLDGPSIDRIPNRRYLFAALTEAMRRILIDHARRRRSSKGPGGRHRVALDALLDAYEERNLDVIAVHEALDRLARLSPRQSQIVAMRVFGGLSMPEVAEQLGCSLSTVESDFRLARAWLHAELGGGPSRG